MIKARKLSIDIEQSITALKGLGKGIKYFYENHKKNNNIFKEHKNPFTTSRKDKTLNMWQVFAKYVYKELVDSLCHYSLDACPLVDFSDGRSIQ